MRHHLNHVVVRYDALGVGLLVFLFTLMNLRQSFVGGPSAPFSLWDPFVLYSKPIKEKHHGNNTNSMGRIPNVLLAGAQKGGTSSIAKLLFQSDQVCRPHKFHDEPFYHSKEVHFFDQDSRYIHGEDFYRQRYEHCTSNHTWVLDGTPDYMPWPDRVHQMYKAHPDLHKSLKIIFSLREPVQREVSWYNHQVRVMDEFSWAKDNVFNHTANRTLTFDQYVERGLRPLLDEKESKSFFYKYLRTWFQLFDREQFLILSFEELQTDSDRIVQRVQDFLQPIDLPTKRLPTSNKSNFTTDKEAMEKLQDQTSCPVQEWLHSVYAPHNVKLYKLLRKNKGPPMEERPFPKFHFRCSWTADQVFAQVAAQENNSSTG